ncbi:RNA polymerase subunit sigma [Bacillus sp. M6-12]|uniref:RNA polymerase sigma factor n=1 Tax=Bacillus sp. M6-12 TaxID=2054166 RepID=UPI000C7591F7|nr:RNA polymerase sigma factor [Bacillus sp. M6-12]PLS15929.1 RNA polymerase subunit sigma [Bacillus sp. M6-12]
MGNAVEKLFEHVYEEYFEDVYRFVYVKTGNKWDADDIVSETFRKVYEKSANLETITAKKAWVFTIARNTVIDFYRKRKTVLVPDEIDYYIEPVKFEDPLDESDELDCLKKSLDVLPREDLEIVNLRYFSGLKFKDIAEVLQKTDGTIRVKSNRIMKKMGILLKKCMGE